MTTSSQIILGMEEGGEFPAGRPREAALNPQKTSIPHYLAQLGSSQETEITPVSWKKDKELIYACYEVTRECSSVLGKPDEDVAATSP